MSEECTHDCNSCGQNCGSRSPESLVATPYKGTKIGKIIGVVSGKGGVGINLLYRRFYRLVDFGGYRIRTDFITQKSAEERNGGQRYDVPTHSLTGEAACCAVRLSVVCSVVCAFFGRWEKCRPTFGLFGFVCLFHDQLLLSNLLCGAYRAAPKSFLFFSRAIQSQIS